MVTFLKHFLQGMLGLPLTDDRPNLHYIKLEQDELMERIQKLEEQGWKQGMSIDMLNTRTENMRDSIVHLKNGTEP